LDLDIIISQAHYERFAEVLVCAWNAVPDEFLAEFVNSCSKKLDQLVLVLLKVVPFQLLIDAGDGVEDWVVL